MPILTDSLTTTRTGRRRFGAKSAAVGQRSPELGVVAAIDQGHAGARQLAVSRLCGHQPGCRAEQKNQARFAVTDRQNGLTRIRRMAGERGRSRSAGPEVVKLGRDRERSRQHEGGGDGSDQTGGSHRLRITKEQKRRQADHHREADDDRRRNRAAEPQRQ